MRGFYPPLCAPRFVPAYAARGAWPELVPIKFRRSLRSLYDISVSGLFAYASIATTASVEAVTPKKHVSFARVSWRGILGTGIQCRYLRSGIVHDVFLLGSGFFFLLPGLMEMYFIVS